MRIFLVLLICLAIVSAFHNTITLKAVPVVIWHGMGDNCCNPFSMGNIKKLIEENVDGVYVKSLMFGDNLMEDTEKGFFADMNDLVADACKQIRNDTLLQFGYNAIGFSQGAQFIRAVAQRCPDPPIKNLISVGGQHQGVFGLPYCPGDTTLCNMIRRLLDLGAYNHYVQHQVVQAQYWHDPLHEDEYKEKSIFLADINNEREINTDYKKNLLNLKNMLLIKFTRDHMVVPMESSWFGYYKEGDIDTIMTMNETKLYTEDRIGLKKLHETGRLHFLEVEGDHLKITREEFKKEVIDKYLK
ncbi:unnamed protein product [Haemonchus placei]|uniref:Palmitoyl-protein thioesterase 1 n=1 Tax=Haemonchus placei TaxID=6290 RepID=A0A0N4WJ68_HAEPC|nr:unnamed protein product [Haemonchus placei]